MPICDWCEEKFDLISRNLELDKWLVDWIHKLFGFISDHDHHGNVEVLQHYFLFLLIVGQMLSVEHRDLRHVQIDRVVPILTFANQLMALRV